MAHQRAGDEGKPSIHIGSQDTKIARRLGIEEDSPSTVYSNSLEMREKWENLREKRRKEARKEIIEICSELEDDFGIERAELLGDLL